MPIVPIDDTNRADSNRVLAHAFRDDPMIRWMMGPSTARDEKVFAFLSRFHRAPGASDLYVDDDGTPVGAAMWNPPGYTEKVNKWLVPLQALAVFRGGFRRSAVVEHLPQTAPQGAALVPAGDRCHDSGPRHRQRAAGAPSLPGQRRPRLPGELAPRQHPAVRAVRIRRRRRDQASDGRPADLAHAASRRRLMPTGSGIAPPRARLSVSRSEP